MRILELTNYSAGVCGVWQRVKQEAELLSKKYEVYIFSSDITKGSGELALPEDTLGRVKIKRFPTKKLGGESFMSWDFTAEAIKLRPDIIIAHSYRHLHTTKALKIAKKINAKVFLVTHAPFIEGNSTRSFFSKVAVSIYDKFIARRILNEFDRIITITKWEAPFLLALGAKKEKISYVPNGIPKEFFKPKISQFNGDSILFFGRIANIKNLETLIKSFKLVSTEYPQLKLKITGPQEQPCTSNLKNLASKLKIRNLRFFPPVYSLRERVDALRNTDIFVLPSISEAMPQALVEAMAVGKIVISSDNKAGKEIISDKKDGFLFKTGDEKNLSEVILFILAKKNLRRIKEIQKQARIKAEEFRWDILIGKIEKLILS
ncbi:MAG: glycosyltransferase family 4 protein [archaeon]